MEIKTVSKDELRQMNGKEALIIQGCGGDIQEWVDGINRMLTDAGILKNNSRFENCFKFKNNGLTCLGFMFDDVELNIEKLALWRIETHEKFGGTWLSDYIPNKLGGYISEEQKRKPMSAIIGVDGNIFNILGIASKTLRCNDMTKEAEEMYSRVTLSRSYEEALGIITEYIQPCTEAEMKENEDLGMSLNR